LEAGFSVMFAGNLGAGQAVETIVEAAALVRDHAEINFVVFGHGSRFAWIQEEINRRGLSNIHLLGRYPIETMPGFMQKASALLVTLADQPIFSLTVPSKVQAYMAAGRPILACLNGEGARLVAEAQAGLVIPAESASGLADSILRLYKMTCAVREEMGENGRRYFKDHFDQDILTDQLIGHFRNVAESCKGN
jgi:glycosyltransferase involved in cell wall biosynthesis